MAICVLDYAIGYGVGWLGLCAYNDDEIHKLNLNSAGYASNGKFQNTTLKNGRDVLIDMTNLYFNNPPQVLTGAPYWISTKSGYHGILGV